MADYVREFKIDNIHPDILEVLDHGTRIDLDVNGEPFWIRFSVYSEADGNRYLIVVCSDPHGVPELAAKMVKLPDDLAEAVTECEWWDDNALRELWERLMYVAYEKPGYFDDFVDEILKWLRDVCLKKKRQ